MFRFSVGWHTLTVGKMGAEEIKKAIIMDRFFYIHF